LRNLVPRAFSNRSFCLNASANINSIDERNDGNHEERRDHDLKNYTVDDLKELIRREREERDDKVNSLRDENAGLKIQRDHAVEKAEAFRKAWLAMNY
jgi:ribosome-binding protein aMBF1 (putative translation factor)